MIARPTPIGTNSSTVRSHNLQAILLTMLRRDVVSRSRLAELTSLSTTAITNIVTGLLQQGIVVEEGIEEMRDRRGAGRPRTALRLVPDARFAVGVHIGIGSVRVGLADLYGRTRMFPELSYPLDQSPHAVLTDTARLVRDGIDKAGVRYEDIVGVGVGAAGLVNPETGVNLLAPNLGWQNVPVRDIVSQHLRLPVVVDNNVRSMALGEALFGAGKDVHTLAFVYGRIGVGSGFVIDGELYHGRGATAGEIGHTTIIPNGGAPCRCGNTGCLETLVSEPVVLRLAEAITQREPNGTLATFMRNGDGSLLDQVFAAARAGDAATQAMLDERAYYMGIALANLVNTFAPDVVILGGMFAQGADVLMPMIEITMRQRAFAEKSETTNLLVTSFGPQAGVVGAAALALNACFYRQAEML